MINRHRKFLRPLSITTGLLLGTLFLLFTLMVSVAEAGTSCKCKRHKAEAEASGTCSRTEDSNYCTLKFSATPPEHRQAFIEFLQEVENNVGRGSRDNIISKDVDRSLNFAFATPPADWRAKDIRSHLPLLFAISQRNVYSDDASGGLSSDSYRFRDTTFQVTDFIFRNAEEILELWSNDNTLTTSTNFQQIGGVDAAVSYGCIQVIFFLSTEVRTMVKTRFSLGGYFCDDTTPNLYPNGIPNVW